MKKWIIAGSIALFTLVVSCKKDDDNNSTQVNTTDQMFMTNVAIGNMAEIQLGQLATTKGTNADVKAYGQMMVSEHGLAQSELQTIANSVGFKLPDSVDAMHQQLRTKLIAMPSGRSWDTAYINSQVRDHQNTAAVFEAEIGGGQHAQVKGYATKYLPHIQMHLAKADSIARKL